MRGVARGRRFLLGGADVLCGLEFATEKDRLRDPTGETPGQGIDHTDAVKCRRAQSARGADRKTWQARGARFAHAMKGGGEALFGGEHIGPAFEELRGQTGGHGAGLAGERGARREPAGRVVTGDNFDGADGLRPGGLRQCKRASCALAARALIWARSKSLAKPCSLRTSASFRASL